MKVKKEEREKKSQNFFLTVWVKRHWSEIGSINRFLLGNVQLLLDMIGKPFSRLN